MKMSRWFFSLAAILLTISAGCRVGNYLQERAWNLLEQPLTRPQQLTYFDRQYTVELRGTYIVAEGDILIGEVRPENAAKFREISNPTQDTLHSLGRIRRTPRSYVWPDGLVPFVFDEGFSENRKQEILDAMNVWQGQVLLNFKTRSVEGDYIQFQEGASGTGCFSDLGRIGGRQIVSVESACFDRGALAHVIGHALGFEHEHTRPDRDAYLEVSTDLLRSDYKTQFQKRPSSGLHVADFDASSLMMYSPDAFAAGDRPVYSFRPAAGRTGGFIRRGTLSGGDYTSASAYYGSAWFTFATDVNGDGTADLVDVRKGLGAAIALTGSGEGFRPRESFGSAEAIAGNREKSLYLTGDFNGDGRVDLMEINRSKRVAFVWKGNASAFSDKNSFGVVKGLAPETELAQYLTGDFNGDGNDDLLEVNREQATTRLWISDGREFQRSEGPGANDIARPISNVHFFAADFNGDGHDDLGEVNRNAGVVFVWPGGKEGLYNWGYYGLAHTISREEVAVTYLLGDFEKDGQADIMEVNRDLGRGRVWSGGKGGFVDYFRSAIGLLPPEAPAAYLLADCNGDGATDLVEIDRTSGQLRAWLSSPTTGEFLGPEQYGVGGGAAKANRPARYFAGDFNGDKRQDILELNLTDEQLYLWPAGEKGFGERKSWAPQK